MKRAITSLLILVMLTMFSGVSISDHYCNGHKIGRIFFYSLGDKCDSEMPMKSGSCSDKVVLEWPNADNEFRVLDNHVETANNWVTLSSLFGRQYTANTEIRIYQLRPGITWSANNKYLQYGAFLL